MATKAGHVLLDLPDLALERIANYLPPAPLASFLQTCSTLYSMLRPQMSAMVRARSLGRRWALRACGRALFADVARRYMAGMANFEHPDPPHNWEAFRAIGQHVAENGPAHILLCTKLKASTAASGVLSLKGFAGSLRTFFYLYLLADSRGFSGVVHILERVWGQVLLEFPTAEGEWTLEQAFQQLRARAKPDFDFRPLEAFASLSLYPSPLWEAVYRVVGSFGNVPLTDFPKRLVKAATASLGAEMLSTMFFCHFVSRIHFFSTREMDPLTLFKFYKGLLDFRQQ